MNYEFHRSIAASQHRSIAASQHRTDDAAMIIQSSEFNIHNP
jgi:hypothetical protein